jgi:hypothetical protein
VAAGFDSTFHLRFAVNKWHSEIGTLLEPPNALAHHHSGTKTTTTRNPEQAHSTSFIPGFAGTKLHEVPQT